MSENEFAPLDEANQEKIHQETALIHWHELQRYYAGGSVIFVSPELDLVKVALALTNDDKEAVAAWMEQALIGAVTDEQALAWFDANAAMWAVVIKPWILVQQDKAE